MPDSPLPFGSGTEAPEAAAGRRKVVAGALAGALVLGAGGYLLLGRGGSPADPVAVGVVPNAAPAAAAPAASTAAKPVVQMPAASTEHLGRNPFKALYVAPVSDTTGGTGTGAGAAGGGSGTTTGTTGTGTSTGTGPAGGATGTGTPTDAPSAAPTAYPLKLVAVSKPSPQARFFTLNVDGKDATVIAAQRFGKYGELVVLAYTFDKAGAATGAIVQVGDDNPIDLSIGEKVSVL